MIMKKAHLLAVLTAGLFFISCGRGNLNLIGNISTPAHHVKTGYRMLAMNKIDDAFREFSYAAGMSPNYAPAYIGMALVHGRKLEPDQGRLSLEHADRYARGKQQELEVHVGAMRFYTAMGENGDRNWLEKVESSYQKAKLVSMDAPEPYYFMGRAYEVAGRFHQAAKQYFRAMEIGGTYLEEATVAYKAAEGNAAKQ